MTIDWDDITARITLTGRAAWIRGTQLGWQGSVIDNDLWFAFEGKGTMLGKGGAAIPISMGTCLWLTPGHVYEGIQDPDDPVRNYYVHFDLYTRDGKLRPYDAPHPAEVLDPGDTAMVYAVMRRITNLIPFFTPQERHRFSEENIKIAEALLRGLLMELDQNSHRVGAGGMSDTLRHRHDVVMHVVALVQDGPDRFYSVAELADIAGYSPQHFSRVFHSVLGISPDEFLIGHRIDRAKHLLRYTSLNLRAISDSLGYRGQAFFSTQFKQRTGLTPSEFREKNPIRSDHSR